MATPDYNNMLKAVSVRLPGASQDVILLELQSLMLEFCDASNVLIQPVPLAAVAGTTDYPIEADFGVINRLMNVVDANNNLVAASLMTPGPDGDDYIVRLRDVPSQSATLTANISLIPDNSQTIDTAVPDWMWTRYRNGLTDGILARMMSQPAKPYTNLQLAPVHHGLYRRVLNQAKTELLHRYQFRGQGWSFPQQFQTRRAR